MRFVPLIGIVVGLIGAAAYWTAAQIWPTHVAVVISMLVSALITENPRARAAPTGHAPRAPTMPQADSGGLYWVFVTLIKYNALMALSAAHAPFSLPAFVTLGLIMVAGQAASRALVVSVIATDTGAALRVSSKDLAVALILGFVPATLLGIPGLAGLAAAIVMRLLLGTNVAGKLTCGDRKRLEVTQQSTEVCFFLGALATWKYI